MQRSSATEEDAFLHAEARELAVLAKECIGCGAARRQPASVLHTLGVELAVLAGLGDDARLAWLAREATQLLADEGKQEAVAAFRATLARLNAVPASASAA